MEQILLRSDIRFIRDVDCGVYTRERYKPLYKDRSGSYWLEKKCTEGDEHIREYVGSMLMKLFSDLDVKSPKIRIHKDIEGYLIEYIPGLEPYCWHGCYNSTDVPQWVKDNEYFPKVNLEDTGVRTLWKVVKDHQRQHIIACLVNDDYDRNLTNYKIKGKDLFVLDQAGGWLDCRGDISFGASALKISRMLIEQSSVGQYKEGIDRLRSAMKKGYYQKIFQSLDKAGIKADAKLWKMINVTINIEDVLTALLIEAELSEEERNRERKMITSSQVRS